ncbi:MAG: metallophosphoesterase [Thermoanaerobacterium sp.]|nr:metallophosphoesterase [Thermoanaerobacterium sp.]
MRQIDVFVPGNYKSIFILPIGDVHFGSKNYNEKYINQVRRFIDKNKNRTRIILMGDLLENATKSSVGRGVYDENYHTWSQFKKAVSTFYPYRNIIDLIIEGNHEERIIRDTSFEIVEELSHRLGRPDAYGKITGLINYIMPSGIVYSVFAWHGATGGTKESSAINGLLSMRERALAHIYLMGHTHKLLSFSREMVIPDPGSKKPNIIEQLFINTGTAVSYVGYGEQKGYPLTKAGFGVIQVFNDERKQVFHRIEDII